MDVRQVERRAASVQRLALLAVLGLAAAALGVRVPAGAAEEDDQRGGSEHGDHELQHDDEEGDEEQRHQS